MDLFALAEQLRENLDPNSRILLLESADEVGHYLKKDPEARDLLERFGREERIVLLTLILLGEGDTIFPAIWRQKGGMDDLYKLLQELVQVERFYAEMGGFSAITQPI